MSLVKNNEIKIIKNFDTMNKPFKTFPYACDYLEKLLRKKTTILDQKLTEILDQIY